MELHMLLGYIRQILRCYISVIIRIGQSIKFFFVEDKNSISVVVAYGYAANRFCPKSIVISSGCYHRYKCAAGIFAVIIFDRNRIVTAILLSISIYQFCIVTVNVPTDVANAVLILIAMPSVSTEVAGIPKAIAHVPVMRLIVIPRSENVLMLTRAKVTEIVLVGIYVHLCNIGSFTAAGVNLLMCIIVANVLVGMVIVSRHTADRAV